MFLEDGKWNGWMDRQWEVGPERQGTRVKSSCTCFGLDPRDWQTNAFAWSQWKGWEWWGKHGVKINRLLFMKRFIGQQTDLEQNSNFFTGNQWREWSSETVSKRRQLCHNMGQSILNMLWLADVSVCNTKVNCSNRDDQTQEQLQVILHYPDQGAGECATDPGYGKNMSCTLLIYARRIFLSNITQRFWADFDALVLPPKSSIGNIERNLLIVVHSS